MRSGETLQKGVKLFLILCCLVCAGCASVRVRSVDSVEYARAHRSDVISSDMLSQQSTLALYILGLEGKSCLRQPEKCIAMVGTAQGLNAEQRLAAMSEVWLHKAMSTEKTVRSLKRSGADGAAVEEKGDIDLKIREARLEAMSSYFHAARCAFAYLFHTDRSPESRSLEDRQNQVRDFYNFATQQAVTILYELLHGQTGNTPRKNDFTLAGWHIAIDASGMRNDGLAEGEVVDLDADTKLAFEGLRNQFVQDGLGARMVATFRSRSSDGSAARVCEPMPYVSVNSLLRFPGSSLDEVMSARRVVIEAHDPHFHREVAVGRYRVPLAANYSAAYGLWLANSNFSKQSLGSLVGMGDIIERPKVFLMQPYRPDLRTIILVHGLASSPEAWVNAANEIMGDEELRSRYQIWQVYYPTSVPIIISRYTLAEAIEKTFDQYDPERRNPASRDVVIVGHSMGGILSRLLVSHSDEKAGQALLDAASIRIRNKARGREAVKKFICFSPLPEISRAVFLAAPHRGTPYADGSIAKFLASFVKLPLTIVRRINDTMLQLVGSEEAARRSYAMSGVGNLSARDPVIRQLATLPVSSAVTCHSIIGNDTPDVPLAESSDGIVPYSSAHFDKAVSEVVIPSGHSVQETPQAIIEIRRILHEHLQHIR